MMSPTGDFNSFVKAVIERDLESIIATAREEKLEGMKMRRPLGRYIEVLNGLAYLLQQGARPFAVHQHEFAAMRPIIERLVEKGQLGPEILRLFQEVKSSG